MQMRQPRHHTPHHMQALGPREGRMGGTQVRQQGIPLPLCAALLIMGCPNFCSIPTLLLPGRDPFLQPRPIIMLVPIAC